MKTFPHRLLATIPLAWIASAALAADPYAGLSWATPGEARLDIGPSTTIRNDNHPTALRLYGGLRFSPEWSVEAGYGAFGHWRFTDPTPGSRDTARISSDVFSLAGRYTVDLDDTFAVFGKAGLALNRFRYRDSLGQSARDRLVRPMWGLGVEARFGDRLSVPLEFESFGGGRTQLGEFRQRKLEIGVKLGF
ncbi:outer membrane beta-barrel protein [Roseateles chitinivorans]|uniref:outer membrane beta-barrel protein n=1 Tax=Roseateles chitinivorans TaxID=2917965 RepID=UPI003D678FD2